MSNTLILRFTDLPDPAIEWLAFDDGSTVTRTGAGGPDILSDLEPADRIMLLFPTSRALFSQVSIPSKNAQQIQQAARALIEEILIDDVDDMHIVTRRGQGNLVDIAAVNHTYLHELVALLEQHQLSPQFALPDCLALPLTDNGWSIFEYADGLLIRTGPFSGIHVDDSWLANATPSTIQELSHESPERLSVYRDNPNEQNNSHPIDYHQWFADSEINAADPEGSHHPISFCANSSNIIQDSNFLVGAFAPKQSNRFSWLNWRLPVYSAAAGLMLFTLILLLQGYRYNNQLQDIRQQTDTVFRQTFPRITTIVDYRLRFERELKQYRAGGQDAEPILHTLYDVFSQLKIANRLALVQLSYSRQNITLDIQSPDIGAAEQFISTLNRTSSYQAKLLSAQNRENGTRIRIKISPGHAS